MALDESIDASDASELLIFEPEIVYNFKITEELPGLQRRFVYLNVCHTFEI